MQSPESYYFVFLKEPEPRRELENIMILKCLNWKKKYKRFWPLPEFGYITVEAKPFQLSRIQNILRIGKDWRLILWVSEKREQLANDWTNKNMLLCRYGYLLEILPKITFQLYSADGVTLLYQPSPHQNFGTPLFIHLYISHLIYARI